jgi:hypothetical protein
MPDLYIHAGPGKTGTTFLQQSVFDKIQSAQCLETPEVNIGGKEIRFADLFDFPPGIWKRAEQNPFFPKAARRVVEKDLVISDERIFGGIGAPQSWIPNPPPGRDIAPAPRRHMHARPDPYVVSRHLKKLREVSSGWGYGQVRFLLTTRRQDTRLASGYAQMSNRVRGAGQHNFQRWVRHLIHDVVGYYKGGGAKLNYSSWWEEIAEVVGEENVLFLPFELLQENTLEFLRQWLGYIGIEEADSIAHSLSNSEKQNRRSKSDRRWALRSPRREGPGLPRRVSWKLFEISQSLGLPKLDLPARLPLRWPDFQRDDVIHLTEDISEEILDVYEEGNRLLDELDPDLNLEEYNYY